jgi:hypothetical protein
MENMKKILINGLILLASTVLSALADELANYSKK